MKLANVIKAESRKMCSLSFISAIAIEMPKRGFWTYVRDMWSGAPVGSCGASKSQLIAHSISANTIPQEGFPWPLCLTNTSLATVSLALYQLLPPNTTEMTFSSYIIKG